MLEVNREARCVCLHSPISLMSRTNDDCHHCVQLTDASLQNVNLMLHSGQMKACSLLSLFALHKGYVYLKYMTVLKFKIAVK